MTGRGTATPAVRLGRVAGRLVPGQSIAVVRIALGVVIVVSAVRLLAHGWVAQLWSQPDLLLGWPALPVPVLPHTGLVAIVAGVGATGLALALGVGPRLAAATFVLGFGYLELLDRTTYLNHYWAMTLLAVLLVVLPTDGTWALWARRRTGTPVWALWVLRGQVAVIYVGAAVAKLDPDWLVRGEPLGLWLAARSDLPLIGPLLALPGAGLAASWAGLLFDLTIVAWLSWRPTRAPAVVAVVAFHAATWVLFPKIGVFPLLMVGLATLWLAPDWPAAATRRAAAVLGRRAARGPATALPLPVVAVRRRTLVLVAVWFAVQVVVPLRHLAIPGDVRWTEEGGRFAWRVMAEEKVGWATLRVTDLRSGAVDHVALTDLLTPGQAHVAAVRPDLLHQLAGALADQRLAADGVRPEVRVDARVAWNGRPNAPLVDPDVDLAGQPWRIGRHQPWILEPPS